MKIEKFRPAGSTRKTDALERLATAVSMLSEESRVLAEKIAQLEEQLSEQNLRILFTMNHFKFPVKKLIVDGSPPKVQSLFECYVRERDAFLDQLLTEVADAQGADAQTIAEAAAAAGQRAENGTEDRARTATGESTAEVRSVD